MSLAGFVAVSGDEVKEDSPRWRSADTPAKPADEGSHDGLEVHVDFVLISFSEVMGGDDGDAFVGCVTGEKGTCRLST